MNVQLIRKSAWVPSGFDRPTLVNRWGVPRFYATYWTEIIKKGSSDASVIRVLSSVGLLYEVADDVFGAGALDVAIAKCDFARIEAIIQTLTARIANGTVRWQRKPSTNHAIQFLADVMRHIGHGEGLHQAILFVERVKGVYSDLLADGPKPPPPLRALPETVLTDLGEVFDPTSSRNPFRTESLRWRNYTIFLLLLLLGLRRAEGAGIMVSSFSERFDARLGKASRWVTITSSEEFDPRYERPGIKNVSSHRDLPLPKALEDLVEFYRLNFRKNASYPYLLMSQKGLPLSIRQISDVLDCASAALSDFARAELTALRLSDVSCHDLRHTCAVFQLQSYQDRGIPIAKAEGKLRRFFGWCDDSDMPRLYGKAFYEPRAHELYENTLERTRAVLKKVYPRAAHA
ncbi:hypothetical protein [Agrobacterium cavarae]|uniref:hypothetical protein n=1 Tax=Agrobacterium cavarae TaxID=2528239 RepID=UPI003EE472E2